MSIKINLRVKEEWWKGVKAEAERKNISASEYLRLATDFYGYYERRQTAKWPSSEEMIDKFPDASTYLNPEQTPVRTPDIGQAEDVRTKQEDVRQTDQNVLQAPPVYTPTLHERIEAEQLGPDALRSDVLPPDNEKDRIAALIAKTVPGSGKKPYVPKMGKVFTPKGKKS